MRQLKQLAEVVHIAFERRQAESGRLVVIQHQHGVGAVLENQPVGLQVGRRSSAELDFILVIAPRGQHLGRIDHGADDAPGASAEHPGVPEEPLRGEPAPNDRRADEGVEPHARGDDVARDGECEDGGDKREDPAERCERAPEAAVARDRDSGAPAKLQNLRYCSSLQIGRAHV